MGLMVDNDIYECPNAFNEKKNWADNIESVASCDPISRKINDDASLQRIPLQIVRNAGCNVNLSPICKNKNKKYHQQQQQCSYIYSSTQPFTHLYTTKTTHTSDDDDDDNKKKDTNYRTQSSK